MNKIRFLIKRLQDPKLEGIINRYVGFEEDRKYIYLAIKLWDYSLDEYIRNIPVPEMDPKTIFLSILHHLRSLHQAGVIHGNINPRAILIDSGKNIRLNIFNRNVLEDQDNENIYTESCDVKAAGKLLYYILTYGKHPFGERDLYNDVEDIVAQNLIEWMINKEPAKRLTIDEVLQHPYFWDDEREDAVLRKLGDRPEVQNYETLAKVHELCVEKQENLEGTDPPATLTINQAISRLKIERKRDDILIIVGDDLQNLMKLFNTAAEVTEGKTFSNWKSELSNIWPDINKKLPKDAVGLLRVLRNKLVHVREFKEKKIFVLFPDFFISLHRLAKDLSWKY